MQSRSHTVRCAGWLAALICFGSAVGDAAGPSATRASPPVPRSAEPPSPRDVAVEWSGTDRALDQATQRKLQQMVDAVDFAGQPIGEVIPSIAREYDVNVFVHWGSLEKAAVMRDTPVTIHLRNVRLGTALRAVLDDAGGKLPVDYVVADGMVHVGLDYFLAERTRVTRVYDCRDLLCRRLSAKDREILTRVLWEIGMREQSRSPEEQQEPPLSLEQYEALVVKVLETEGYAERVEDLRQVIMRGVEPESWRENGGECEIDEFDGMLVVTQTPSRHDELETLLADLRRTRAARSER